MHFQNQSRALSAVILLLLIAASLPAQTLESLASNDIKKEVAAKKNIRLGEVAGPEINYAQRVEDLKRELLSSPDDPLIYNNLGAAYVRLKNYEEALAALEKAVALKPDFINALYNLSIVYDHLERFAEALTVIEKAVALDAENVNARTEMCQIYMATRKFSEAAGCYEILIKMKEPEIIVRVNYGVALLQLKQYDKARLVLEENVAAFPNQAVTHNALGMLLFVKGKYRQALKCFRRAIELDARFEPARFNLALAQLQTNDRASALKQYALLKNSNPGYAEMLYKFIYRDRVVYANK